MTGLFTGYLHHYDTYNMTDPFADYLYTYYIYK
jgi:hypothetical protein